MKVLFMGAPPFAVPTLRGIFKSGHRVRCVWTQVPRVSGRGMAVRPTAVATAASRMNIPVQCPTSLAEAMPAMRDMKVDVGVVVAYGRLIPKALLDVPQFGFINVHPSLLPRWRGAAPIQRAIMAGDRETGVCIIRMNEALDSGPVLLSRRIPVEPLDTGDTLTESLSILGAELCVEALNRLPDIEPVSQPQTGITYASKISKRESRIDWSLPASRVDSHIRGLSRFPGAWSVAGGVRTKFLLSKVVDATGPPGVVLNDRFEVGCGRGAIRVLISQRAGSRVIGTEAMSPGERFAVGAAFV